MSRPTLQSLAAELSLSRQTISNALNRPEVVRPDTLERVLAAIEASGYRPSALGKALRSQRSHTIGLRLRPVVDGINGAVLDRFLHALTEAAQAHGYRVTLFTADTLEEEIDRFEDLYRVSSIDACVLIETFVDDPRPELLAKIGIPTVAFGRPWGSTTSTHHWVDIDGLAGTRAAATWFRESGHTRIGYLGWPAGSGLGDDRRAGWRAACHDLPGADDLDLSFEDGMAEGFAGAGTLLARGATAVVCGSDSLAIGAMSEFRIAFPEAHPLPVVGYDDTPVAAALGLSSVHQPVEEAAQHCVRVLMSLLAGEPDAQPRELLLTPTLVKRAFTPML